MAKTTQGNNFIVESVKSTDAVYQDFLINLHTDFLYLRLYQNQCFSGSVVGKYLLLFKNFQKMDRLVNCSTITSTRCSVSLRPKLWTGLVAAAFWGAFSNKVCWENRAGKQQWGEKSGETCHQAKENITIKTECELRCSFYGCLLDAFLITVRGTLKRTDWDFRLHKFHQINNIMYICLLVMVK